MKISIITINYNNAPGLERTLETVRAQRDRDFEYIVVDGGSSDGSRDIIKKNYDIIDKWVSEPDKGIYNAMNKGVAMASGDYCLFLNSGDYLHSPDSMGKALRFPFKADIILSRVLNHDDKGNTYLYIPSETITLREIYQTGIHHAGSFIKTGLMRDYPYREDLKICSDRDFFIKTLIFDNVSYEIINEIICDFEYGGVSSNMKLVYNERTEILKTYLPPRLIEEYGTTNLQLMRMTSHLEKCRYKFISVICKIDLWLIKTARMLLGKKLDRKKYL